jgi:hypothetical protein
MHTPALLYTRELPGGGVVWIEATKVRGAAEGTYRASLCVERRADPARRSGHKPPVVAEAEGVSAEEILEALYPIAVDNVAVARQILLWQATREPAN